MLMKRRWYEHVVLSIRPALFLGEHGNQYARIARSLTSITGNVANSDFLDACLF